MKFSYIFEFRVASIAFHYLNRMTGKKIPCYQKDSLSEFHKDSLHIDRQIRYKIKRSSKIFYFIRYMGSNLVLTRFNLFLAQGHVVITKILSPNFNSRTHRLTDMFGKNSAISSWLAMFDALVLEKLQPDFDNFWA